MLQFITEKDVAREFKKLRPIGNNTRIAVAFWGDKAIESLNLNQCKGARIICNLESGACDPAVIGKLCKIAVVKSNPCLHAKVYATDRAVILGSSNASINGLALQQKQLKKFWLEANIITTDSEFIVEVHAWFDKLWTMPRTKKITKPMINEAQRKWDKRPNIIPVDYSGRSIIEACKLYPDCFKNVYLAVYKENLSREANNQLRKVREGRIAKNTHDTKGLEVADLHKAWGYENWTFPSGAWLIDINVKNPERPKIYGYAKLFDPLLKLTTENGDLSIAIHQRAIVLPEFGFGLHLKKQDKSLLLRKIRPKLNKIKDAQLIPLVKLLSD